MTLEDILQALAAQGNETTRRTYLRHGAPEPLFGVRIGDLQPLRRKLKGRQDMALALYATGNSDAMYLAGLVAEGAAMTRRQLDQWAKGATWHLIAGSTVPGVAAEHPEAVAIATKWIDSRKELIATAGWGTLAAVVSTVPDGQLPIEHLDALLDRCVADLASSPNRVRYAMNGFVIACGTYVLPLADKAIAAARQIGPVEVDMGDTDCRVPEAESYILKSRRGKPVAPKRKSARC